MWRTDRVDQEPLLQCKLMSDSQALHRQQVKVMQFTDGFLLLHSKLGVLSRNLGGYSTPCTSLEPPLDWGPGCPTGREIWGSEPPVRSDAAYRQITLDLVTMSTKRHLRSTYRVWIPNSVSAPENGTGHRVSNFGRIQSAQRSALLDRIDPSPIKSSRHLCVNNKVRLVTRSTSVSGGFTDQTARSGYMQLYQILPSRRDLR